MSLQRLHPGARLAPRVLQAVDGTSVSLPDRNGLIHLQLRRFAGCPACNLHLRSIALRHGELVEANVREVVVYRSPAMALEASASALPFALVADPTGSVRDDFGADRSLRAVLDPRAWPALVKGGALGLGGAPVTGEDPLAQPAEFLIDCEGRVLDCKYGAHADDQWSVDEILSRVRRSPGATSHQNLLQTIQPEIPDMTSLDFTQLPSTNRTPRARLSYWLTTCIAAAAFLVPGVMNLLHAPHIMSDMAHLGYPTYFPSLLGPWKVAGALAILAPGLPRMKEWAYAGMIFDLTAAAGSRAVNGDELATVLIPLLIAGVVLTSWAQRPGSRKLRAPT